MTFLAWPHDSWRGKACHNSALRIKVRLVREDLLVELRTILDDSFIGDTKITAAQPVPQREFSRIVTWSDQIIQGPEKVVIENCWHWCRGRQKEVVYYLQRLPPC